LEVQILAYSWYFQVWDLFMYCYHSS